MLFRPAPKKVAELNEGHVTRHLAFAFVGFLERQMTSEGVAEEDAAEMKVAKEAIKKAFKLPEDDSLKVSHIFFVDPVKNMNKTYSEESFHQMSLFTDHATFGVDFHAKQSSRNQTSSRRS